MILTLLPNPSLDKTVVIPGFALGAIHRTGEAPVLAGGKGFNFARALRALGETTLVVTPLAGYEGRRLKALAEQEGFAVEGVTVSGELRNCLSVIDPARGNLLTEIYENRAPLQAGEWERLVARAATHFAEARFLAVCGSFPPGMPDYGLRDVLELAGARGLPVLLDTAGPQTLDALPLGPALLKINSLEASALLDQTIVSAGEAVWAAKALQQRGAQAVIITLGRDGAVGVTAEGKSFGWAAPPVVALSPVGSGDSAFAGIVAGLTRGQSLQEATRLGMAAGAANTQQLGAGKFHLDQVERLLPLVEPLTDLDV